MSKIPWNEVTREDILKAIHIFNSERPTCPEPRTTFLVFNGKKYPAKHIRGMAYQIHFGREIRKGEYSGGQDTVRFFEKLGFEMHYVHRNVNTHPVAKAPAGASMGNKALKMPLSSPSEKYNNTSKKVSDVQKISVPAKGVIEQKNALQLLLRKYRTEK